MINDSLEMVGVLRISFQNKLVRVVMYFMSMQKCFEKQNSIKFISWECYEIKQRIPKGLGSEKGNSLEGSYGIPSTLLTYIKEYGHTEIPKRELHRGELWNTKYSVDIYQRIWTY